MTHIIRFSSILAALAIVGTPTAQTAQQPASVSQPQLFRAGTDLVRLDVSVLDKNGVPVRGLSASDFSVLEDDAPQAVVAFAAVDLPGWSAEAAPWVREVAPDVISNRPEERRAVVVLFDDIGIRFDPGVAQTARAVGAAVIDGLGPADIGAVVYTCYRRAGQEFTVDREKLRAAVNRFVPTSTAPFPDTAMSAAIPTKGLVMPSRIGPTESGACHNSGLQALRNAAEILGGWPGARKIIVFVNQGQPLRDNEKPSEISLELQQTLNALQTSNVSVYEFDPRGLEVELRTTDFGLFADNVTGGRSFSKTNNPEQYIPRMFRENDSYYLLGFRPTNTTPDGRFRRIKVRVHRPDVEVRSRAGYYALPDRVEKKAAKPIDPLDRALSSGFPTGDLPLSLSVVPVATVEKPGGALAVLARIDRLSDTPSEAALEFVAVAFDETWKEVAGNTQRIGVPGTAAPSAFSEMGMRLNVKPGRYEVRVAVRSLADGRIGTVYSSVTVPDFAREPLSLSGVFVSREAGGASVLENLAALVPAGMTTERIFSKVEPVRLVTRVYQSGARTASPVRIATTVRDARNASVFVHETVLEPTAFDSRRQADHRIELPLKDLVAGEYLVTVDAKTPAKAATRELRFRVQESGGGR